mmetsp:Transcript_22414/g.40181  ORF Transcript_22414/g.40181 Transcript_22414/m.40181 type:complete len:304 (+) Transcript_22414:78-989(+)
MPRNEEQNALCKARPIAVRITVWCLSFVGFVLSSLAVSSCRFIKLATITDAGSISVAFVGIYSFQSSSGICVPLSLLSQNSSSSLKAARAFGVLAALFGGVVTMWILISIMFTGTNKPLWITMASLLVASTAFQLIIFIAFNDESCKGDNVNEIFVDCSIAEGSAFAISASLFYLLACIGMFIVSPPRVSLIRFEKGWRGGRAEGRSEANNGNSKATALSVVMPREEQAGPAPTISSTSPLMESVPPIDNLLNAGASVCPSGASDEESDGASVSSGGAKNEESDISTSEDTEGIKNIGIGVEV